MFTGIIEQTGRITDIRHEDNNIHFTVESGISNELKIDQSVSHNGVCLTVTKTDGNRHEVTAIKETLEKTNLDALVIGSPVNLERSVSASRLLDGHIVQGHVDTVGEILRIEEAGGSWNIYVRSPIEFAPLYVQKGSICVDGISLTIAGIQPEGFHVSIIPYTWEHTNLKYRKSGEFVNLEFDIIGKYILRYLEVQNLAISL